MPTRRADTQAGPIRNPAVTASARSGEGAIGEMAATAGGGFPPRRDVVTAALRAAGCVFADEEADVIVSTARTGREADAMTRRRAAGAPLEQVVGWADFAGVRVKVEPGVFVPRRRSEFLVAQALSLVRARSVVVDLCCGSGAVAAAVARAAAGRGIQVFAGDIDPAAVRCARRNLAGLAEVGEGDLFDAVPARLRGHVDVVVANVPYVPSAQLPLLPAEAREHEPPRALDGGADGLDVQRRLAAAAARWLAPGGSVLVEASDAQAPAAAAAFAAEGLRARVARSDEFEISVAIGAAVAG